MVSERIYSAIECRDYGFEKPKKTKKKHDFGEAH